MYRGGPGVKAPGRLKIFPLLKRVDYSTSEPGFLSKSIGAAGKFHQNQQKRCPLLENGGQLRFMRILRLTIVYRYAILKVDNRIPFKEVSA